MDVSVVIPTFERRAQLERVLAALDRQQTTTPTGRRFTFEVVVVSDGSTDGSVEYVRALQTSYPLSVIEQENAGPAAARNLGVSHAVGDIIAFIDDDVVPGPSCLAAHVNRHDGHDALVVIGPMLTPTTIRLSPWVAWEQHQLEKQYQRFAEGALAYHRQFYTGNASLRRCAFVAAGGFDTRFRRAEDVEIAYRLHLAGQVFAFEASAVAHHFAQRSLASWKRIAFEYGRHDVVFARAGRPELFAQISTMFAERHLLQRVLVRAVVRNRAAARAAQESLSFAATICYRLRLHRASRLLLSGAYGVGYYRGVAHELGSTAALVDLLRGRLGTSSFRIVFLLEQTLGHVTHGQNLESLLANTTDADVSFTRVEHRVGESVRWIPGWGNWTVRAGVRARRALRGMYDSDPTFRADSLFVHSQVPAILLGRWMRRVPTVVSLDATPRQYDELGDFYAHSRSARPVEWIKHVAHRRCFSRARHLVTWSQWAKDGLVDDYAVDPARVSVIPPGVDTTRWAPPNTRKGRAEPVRVLFVGGDFQRKGGHLLLQAAQTLRETSGIPGFEIDVVTTSDVPACPGVVVHRHLEPNSAALVERYQLADIFCLPTFGDCLPMVLAEAGSTALPLISTDVGAIGELVKNRETGYLVPPGDVAALTSALAELLQSADERLRLGDAARQLVERQHDARTNAGRLLETIRARTKMQPT